LINVAQNSLVTGKEARRWGNQHPNLVPYQLFQTADRPMIVAVGSDAQWKSFANVAGLNDLRDDPSLATNAGRLAARDKLIMIVAEKMRERTAAEWMSVLSRAGVPAGVVKSVLESLAEATASPLTGIAPATPGSVRLPPPRLDEHGDEIRRRGWGAFVAV
jgi:crotonobetainyl-CoA:carnitine CoA-transferase CaiB-like acyl-CoA transferase